MPDTGYFHLHLVSDATGETLITVARAAAAQYANVSPVEHLYPMVRSKKQLDLALAEIAESPGLVLYTLLEEDLIAIAGKEMPRARRCPACRCWGRCCGCSSPISAPKPSTASAPSTCSMPNISSASTRSTTPCCMTTASTSKGCEDADVVLVGVSRTSKTPTSIYLANRGVKTGNVPLVPGVPLAPRGRDADAAAGGRALCQPRAHRADPREPAARA